jgi:hypothetical protein
MPLVEPLAEKYAMSPIVSGSVLLAQSNNPRSASCSPWGGSPHHNSKNRERVRSRNFRDCSVTLASNVMRYDRLRRGDYYADFRRDKRLTPPVYHCVVQRDGSAEILVCSQHGSLDAAIRFAKEQLKHFSAAYSKAA